MLFVKKLFLVSCVMVTSCQNVAALQQASDGGLAPWCIIAAAGVGTGWLGKMAYQKLWPETIQKKITPDVTDHSSKTSSSDSKLEGEQKNSVDSQIQMLVSECVRAHVDEYVFDLLPSNVKEKLPADKRPFAALVDLTVQNTQQLAELEKVTVCVESKIHSPVRIRSTSRER
jgi:hypothetical protein